MLKIALVVIGMTMAGSAIIGPSISAQFHYSVWAIADIVVGTILVITGVGSMVAKYKSQPRENRHLQKYEKVSVDAIAATEKIVATQERKRLQALMHAENEAAEEMSRIGFC